MPGTIDEGFRDFLRKLTPSTTESESARKHRASIEACLKNKLERKRFFRMGSFGNGTSISGYSDVDYFASIPRKYLSANSDASLRKVRDVLDERFPNTGVRVNCPAVKVPFGTLARETTEVVPADFMRKTQSGYYVYDIPDCAGEWMKSSPEAHNAYVRKHDKRLGYKLKPLIRFLKAWKYHQSIRISSFYLELRTTKYAEGEDAIIYSVDVEAVFQLLYDVALARMQDPLGISGYVESCQTEAQLEDAKSKLLTAVVRAEKAREAEIKDEIKDAFHWWNLLYDHRFPNYYRI